MLAQEREAEPSTSIDGANENVLEIDGAFQADVCRLGKTTNPYDSEQKQAYSIRLPAIAESRGLQICVCSTDRWDAIRSSQVIRSLIQPGIESTEQRSLPTRFERSLRWRVISFID